MDRPYGVNGVYDTETTVPVEYVDEFGRPVRATRTVRPWMAGASVEQLRLADAEARRRGAGILSAVTAHPNWRDWRDWGLIELGHITVKASRPPAPFAEMVRYPLDDADWTDCWRGVLSLLLNRVFGTRVTYVAGEELVSRETGPALNWLIAGREQIWIRQASEVLAVLGEPRDRWHQRAVLAALVAPQIALGLLGLPFWLQSAGPGADPRLRVAGTATGAADITERLGYRAKRDWHRRAGFEGRPAKPGPKVGTERQPTPAQRAFDAYVGARRTAGVSPQALADDAEAARLYRKWKNDQGASLNEAIVRAALRRS